MDKPDLIEPVLNTQRDYTHDRKKELEDLIHNYTTEDAVVKRAFDSKFGSVYKLLADKISEIVFSLTPEGKLNYISPHIRQISLYKVEELLGRDVSEFVHPEDSERYIQLFDKLGSCATVSGDLRFLDLNGRIVWLRLSIRGYRVDGQLEAIFGIAEDISEKKSAELALIDSWERNHAILNSMPDTLLFFDRDGNHIDMYAQDNSFLGLRKAELLSKNIREIGLSEYYTSQFVNKMDIAFTTRTVQSVEYVIRVENDIQYFEARLNTLNDNELLAVIRNITQRKEQERLLQQSEKRFRSLFANLIEPTSLFEVIYNFNGTISDIKILDVNKAFENLTGFKREQLNGKLLSEIQKNYFITPKIEAIKEVLEFGKSLKFDSQAPDGRFFSISVFALGYNKIAAILEDITERKRYQDEILKAKDTAEEANKLKTNILQNLGHEFRTPLNGILGFTNLLKESIKSEDDKEMLQCIIDSARRLERTLNSILSLSEIENNHLKTNIESVHLPTLVRSKTYQYEYPIVSKNLKFDIVIKDENAVALADEYLLNQVLYNLMDNAIKFTNKGSITIEVDSASSKISEFAIIRVKDTGIGISQKSLNSIFDEFRQASEGINRNYEGVGLGLSISKKMLDLQKGKIEVESRENIGSTFTLKLPMAPMRMMASE